MELQVKKKLLSGLIAALCAAGAQAAPTYIYTDQNVLFGFNQTDENSFTLRIKGALDATGDWADAVSLDNLGFKNLGFDPTGGQVNPGNWAWSPNELTANGCAGGDSGGVCFDAMPAIALTNDMTFTVDLLGGVLALDATHAPHLKLRFLDAQGNKEGSLLSQDMRFLTPGSPDPFDVPPGTVPEPTSLALAGFALLALTATARKRKQA